MAAEFEEVICYVNEKLSRGQLAGHVVSLLHNFKVRQINSRWPNALDNAHDLAEEIDEGTGIVVVGGDGQFHSAVNAAALAGKKGVMIKAVGAGNSCDGAFTQDGNKLRSVAMLPQILRDGKKLPVNALRLAGALDCWAALYTGAGMTAYGAETANKQYVRQMRKLASIGGRCHRLGRAVDSLAVGGTLIRRTFGQEFDLEIDGEPRRLLDFSAVIGHRIAGSIRTNGDAFRVTDPMMACVEISRRSLTHGHAASILGSYALRQLFEADYTRSAVDLSLPPNTLVHVDGEHTTLTDGGLLNIAVAQTYHTMVSAARAEELANVA